MLMTHIHPFNAAGEPPARFNNPFDYEPHALCRQAAHEVKAYIEAHADLLHDANRGKMFGVLVVETDATTHALAFLAAYSGLLAGRNDWPWFVPPVYDAQSPDGYFKRHERHITELNHEIEQLETADDYQNLRHEHARLVSETAAEVEAYRKKMQAAKLVRDMRRLQRNLSPDEHAALIRESQFMKAELHRMKKRLDERLQATTKALDDYRQRIDTLKQERKRLSDDLQRWLFAQYILRNARGEKRSLLDVFAQHMSAKGVTADATMLPPAGSGDCCAPKLLQEAYRSGLRPLCMAEFWWGESPQGEVRHHLSFYPACRGKCLPILPWMMEGLDVDGSKEAEDLQPEIVYEDEALAVVCKPAGMLSVPGKISRLSVEEFMRRRWHDDVNPLIVHRLDMATSGLMVVARTEGVHEQLQKQFLNHEVRKQYVALLDGVPASLAHVPVGYRGTISLPLRPDLMDRPRQMVDREHGKEAVTEYELLGRSADGVRLLLTPLTGRTHQLRLHCAHGDGLGVPIRGDELYGIRADRLCLHASRLSFRHPRTQQLMDFSSEAPF